LLGALCAVAMFGPARKPARWEDLHLADPLLIPTGIELTSLDRRFREDPYPVLATLRAHDPVHRDEVFGRYVLTRYDDVMAERLS
jgi:cytochrome P450